MPIMKFILVNEASMKIGGKYLGQPQLERIARAILCQMNGEFANVWGGQYGVRTGLITDVKAGECVVSIKDKLPDAPGAQGYHDKLLDGTPVIYIALAGLDSFDTDNNSLSVVISHEILEAAGDPAANRWVDQATGIEEALEMCDRVQDVSYVSLNGVALSDFLLPSAFNPKAARPYSWCDSLVSYGALTSGGYALVRSVKDDEHQVFVHGERSEYKIDRHSNPSSRAAKRGFKS